MTGKQSGRPETASNPIWWTILAGMVFGVAALVAAPLAGLEISSILDNREGEVTWATLFAGVFLTGCSIWWLLISRPRRPSLLRGAIAGVLVAFFSYPVVNLLAELFQRGWRESADISAYEDRGGNILLRTILTLSTTGFAATFILAAAGLVTAWVIARLDPTAVAVRPDRARRGFWRVLPRIAGVFALVIVAFLVSAFALLSLLPINTSGLVGDPSASRPAETHAQAMAMYRSVQAKEATMPLNPRCHSTLLTHGEKVQRVVIYFHGLTSCPAQADELAPRLFALGYNVYVPRIFGHGEADPLTLALAHLTAEDMMDLANESMDIANGLGDEVVVTGLSAGGTIAAWIAQYRPDADRTIAIAPFLGPYIVPQWATHAATNLLLLLPNAMVWWNPVARGNPPELSYAYPRFATRGLAQVMRLGAAVETASRRVKPLGMNSGMLLNAADLAVSNPLAEQVAMAWRNHGAEVSVETIPLSRRLPHDLIDPRQPGGDTEFVYSLLIELMNGTPQ
jgi:alpha-beta hydrolase superfamily lysophospholipase